MMSWSGHTRSQGISSNAINATRRRVTRTTRMPASWLPILLSHIIILDPKSEEDKIKVNQSYKFKNSPKFQFFKFWNKHYTRHTFWSCLIRCANMKWIQWVFRRYRADTILSTDGQTRWNQHTPLSTLLKREVWLNQLQSSAIITQSNITWYCIHHFSVWDRLSIRV